MCLREAGDQSSEGKGEREREVRVTGRPRSGTVGKGEKSGLFQVLSSCVGRDKHLQLFGLRWKD